MASEPIVEISDGKLKGKQIKTENNVPYFSFKGIPYAKPPVGELRFSISTPPEPWEGVRDVTENCNMCAQFDKETNRVMGSEDCLYLNVYTPQLSSDQQLPVMFFLHGGGFVFGHGTDDSAHGPDYLIEKNVVMVSINYRLGVLGFLSLGVKEAPGNMGLRDQVLALKWVQKNISKFGGDPNNVTIFGISAGGASVEYLLLSPTAKGLFHKAISHSGSSLLHWAQNNNGKELAAKIPLVKKENVSDDQLLQYLKELPIEELISGSMTALFTSKSRGGIKFGFVPTVEKSVDWEPFLDRSSYEMLSTGEFMKVPYITGVCEREGLLVLGLGGPLLEKVATEKNLIDYLPFKINDTIKPEIEQKLKSIYLDDANKFGEPDAFAIDFFSDVDFIGGIYVASKLLSKFTPVYFYDFTYDGGYNYLKQKISIKRAGACHGDDGGYLIKTNMSSNVTETDNLVRDRIATMWTNFAKHGDPTPKMDDLIKTKWEPLTVERPVFLRIDKEFTMETELYTKRVKFYEELYQKYYDN